MFCFSVPWYLVYILVQWIFGDLMFLFLIKRIWLNFLKNFNKLNLLNYLLEFYSCLCSFLLSSQHMLCIILLKEREGNNFEGKILKYLVSSDLVAVHRSLMIWIALQKHFWLKSHAIYHVRELEQTGNKLVPSHVNIPASGNDVWEIDTSLLKYERKLASGSYGDL